ncbi:hypothetical protein LNO89_01810 [Klebsiella pneumoniae subsp. pneumoniae]|nr:hypothetical protein [Klebsiella pneumoniae subsp. pneumoniae]
MAEVINNSRSVIILSNSFLFNIANVMRGKHQQQQSEGLSGRAFKQRTDKNHPSEGGLRFYSYPDRTMDKLMPVYK